MFEKIEYIKNLSFFDSLEDEHIKNIDNISNLIKYPKGSMLYYENDNKDKIFFLISGLLKVYKMDKYDNEIFLYHIHKNSLISELTSVNENSIYCFSNAEFMEDSIVLEVDFKYFRENFLSKNILTYKFINEILLKTHQLHCVVNREIVFDATAKVAFMLNDDLEIFNSLKRQEVSFMLHIQPETLSRVLKRLKRDDIIEIDHTKVIIKNQQALQEIYKGY